MRQNLDVVPRPPEGLGDSVRRGTIRLWSDTNTVELAIGRRHLAQEGSMALLAKFCGQALGVLLVAKTTQLHGPHPGGG